MARATFRTKIIEWKRPGQLPGPRVVMPLWCGDSPHPNQSPQQLPVPVPDEPPSGVLTLVRLIVEDELPE